MRGLRAALGCAASPGASPLRLPRFLLLVSALAAALLVSAPYAHAGSGRSEGGHLVRWDGGLDEVGERAIRQLPVIRKQVSAALGFALRGGPAEVVLVTGLERMRQEAGAGVPEWAGGVYVGSRGLIVLRVDLVDGRSLVRSMATTLRHEWVHLTWHRRAGANTRRLPLWLEEGIAEEIGGGISVGGGMALDWAAKWGKLLPLDEISRSWPRESARAALAYRQGQSWVRYFRDNSGWDRLQRILADLADGKGVRDGLSAGSPFEELVYEHSGSTVSHWNAAWRLHLEETAEPLYKMLVRDFMGTIFLLIALVGFVSAIVVWRRRRRQIAELPDVPSPHVLEGDMDP